MTVASLEQRKESPGFCREICRELPRYEGKLAEFSAPQHRVHSPKDLDWYDF
jgi:hypothetical protein